MLMRFLRAFWYPLLAGALVLSLVIVSCSMPVAESPEVAEASQSSSPPPPAVPVKELPQVNASAVRMTRNYADNEIFADEFYTERIIRLTGVVESVGREQLPGGTMLPAVTLKGDGGLSFDVRCVFLQDSEKQLARLAPGQELVVWGMCKGKSHDVLMWPCQLEPDKPQEKARPYE